MLQPNRIGKPKLSGRRAKRTIKFVMTCIDDHCVRLVGENTLRQIPDNVTIHSGHTQIDNLNVASLSRQQEFLLQLIGKTVVKIIGKPLRTRSAKYKHPKRVRQFLLSKYVGCDLRNEDGKIPPHKFCIGHQVVRCVRRLDEQLLLFTFVPANSKRPFRQQQ